MTIARLDYDKADIRIQCNTLHERRRLRSCASEPFTVAWIEAMEPGDVFYDVGANVGTYSLIAFKYHEGRVKVLAIEPGMPSALVLRENIYLNQAEAIWVFDDALSDHDNIEPFYYSVYESGSAYNRVGDAGNDGRVRKAHHNVSVCRMDTLAEEQGIWPTHIKVDTDGDEARVLAGAPECLKRAKSVMIEVNTAQSELLESVHEAMDVAGLTLVQKWDLHPGNKDNRDFNYLFERA